MCLSFGFWGSGICKIIAFLCQGAQQSKPPFWKPACLANPRYEYTQGGQVWLDSVAVWMWNDRSGFRVWVSDGFSEQFWICFHESKKERSRSSKDGSALPGPQKTGPGSQRFPRILWNLWVLQEGSAERFIV